MTERMAVKSATDILRREHEAIVRMLDVSAVVADRLSAGRRVEPEILTQLLDFFRLFADRCHHGKEEDLLFPLLERKGLLRAGGPIGVMMDEHTQGRAQMEGMSAAAEAYGNGDTDAGRRWATAMNRYATLLRQHIDKENQILFVLADRLLSAAEQAEMVAAFERAEVEKMGAGTHERLHALMDQLSAAILPCG
ncbi:MAG: hemerythrin domain-containing protein [Candidatus Acidiferrales bacterium]